ncbi:MAG: thermonuclease family protein [Verrucomicrobiales bacterium]
MFYAIRRIIKFFVLLFFVCVGVVMYQNRHVFEPVGIWYEVYQNNGFKKGEALPVVSGAANYVTDSRTFQLKRAKMPLFIVRLAGLDEPNLRPTSVEAAKAEAEGKKILKELIEGEVVNVDVTYNANNSGLGICYRGQTNINLHLIKEGIAQLKPEYIKPLPAKLQYEFFHARRVAMKKNKTVTSTE